MAYFNLSRIFRQFLVTIAKSASWRRVKIYLLSMTLVCAQFGCSSQPAANEPFNEDTEISADTNSNANDGLGAPDANGQNAGSSDIDLEKEFSASENSQQNNVAENGNPNGGTPGLNENSGDLGGSSLDGELPPEQARENTAMDQGGPSLDPQTPAPMANQSENMSGNGDPMLPETGGGGGGSGSNSIQKVTGLKYQANDAGGTLVIETDGPVQYTTRSNAETNQLVVELNNTKLPKKFKRNLNTRDMAGSIGAVDAYENPGSTTARVVVQLRKGFPPPTVQQEGNSILVIADGGAAGNSGVADNSGAAAAASGEMAAGTDGAGATSGAPNGVDASSGGESSVADSGMDNIEEASGGDGPVLQSHNLSEFLGGNTKFYGKRINLETNDMDVRDALKFIMLESGVNMVVAEEVKGKVSLKLREGPWDQALVMVMRAKKLGYTRTGNVLRIAPLADLRQEEDDATKLAREHKTVQSLKVRMFPVNYSKVDELEKKVKEFLSERGKVVSDPRTNYLVVSDIEESLNRVAKLIAGLDIQPPQVLIEGRIVEAKDSFKRSIGFTWGSQGQAVALGKKNLTMTPQLSVNPLVQNIRSDTTGIGSFGLNLGVLDFLGQLDATLILAERDETVKVISSPRVVTMTNEKANINEKTQIPIKRTIITNGQSQTTYEFKDLNLKLEVTPQVTTDGSVIMQVEVMREVQGAAVNIADQTPSINSRQATTRVLVKNGQTAIIGGIYQNDVTELSEGVPYLKDIPGLGFLFRNKVSTREKQELLVFLTPRILSQVDAQNLPNPGGGVN